MARLCVFFLLFDGRFALSFWALYATAKSFIVEKWCQRVARMPVYICVNGLCDPEYTGNVGSAGVDAKIGSYEYRQVIRD